MKLPSGISAALVIVTALAAFPASAEPGKGRGGHHRNDHRHQAHRDHPRHDRAGHPARYTSDCPPGLAKKHPRCVPPGQARHHDHDRDRYGRRIGDILRVGDYDRIRDRDRYDLDYRDGWDYYRDQDHVYRVDSGTRKILAVLNLIDAFAN